MRVFANEGSQLVVRSVRVEDLPGMPPTVGRARYSLDANTLRVNAPRVELSVPVPRLAALGRGRAIRPLLR